MAAIAHSTHVRRSRQGCGLLVRQEKIQSSEEERPNELVDVQRTRQNETELVMKTGKARCTTMVVGLGLVDSGEMWAWA